jgi:acetolactate synthase I/II/III large subunit
VTFHSTGAHEIVRMLQGVGVKRLFGVPGGGSNADVIEAAASVGLPFTLAHTETASAFMAAAQAEITGKTGACMATLGPGAASLMNGVANAYLDRVSLVILTDCRPGETSPMQHQMLSHLKLFSSVVKWGAQLQPQSAHEQLREAVRAVATFPRGAIHLDISTEFTSAATAADTDLGSGTSTSNVPRQFNIPLGAQQVLHDVKYPAILLGLGARSAAIAEAVRELCEHFHIPALVTYKAKGVIPDHHPWFGGVFTNGALEREVLDRADAFFAIGLDPVELLPTPWRRNTPVISITESAINQQHIPIFCELVGPVVTWLKTISKCLGHHAEWKLSELRSLVERQRDAMRPHDESALSPHGVVDLVAQVYRGCRITVDAGAFMFPVMGLWPAEDPLGVLISNGLATMGFALPAAIGASLLDPSKPTIAFTGDGGLLMCLGELRTASREALPLRIIVFDDGELSLIKIKQVQRGYQPIGVSIGALNWNSLGQGLGVLAVTATTGDELKKHLRDTSREAGPVLIAAKINPGPYQATIKALRG